MSAETYQQFKTRVTDGQNLVEIDPQDLNASTRNEPFTYVQKLRAEHKAAILAKHKRVVKKPIVISEVVQGEVSETQEQVPEKPAENLISSTEEIPHEADVNLDVLREANRTKELVLRERTVVLTEMAFAWVMGVFSGYGIYLVTKDMWSVLSKFLVKLFIK